MSSDFADQSRISLGHLPTPLEPLNRLSKELGGSRIWIKRDDCTGLATGGNKTRKLEFLLGDAMAKGADTVLTFGAVQSNHARQTAAACARLGLECHLMLSRAVPWPQSDYESTGNVLLDRILGATVHLIDPKDVADASHELHNRLASRGRNVYVIPTGGSNAIGALGYVAAAQEILSQARSSGFTPDLIIHATSSGGTQAGLAAGLSRTPTRLLGINVSDPDHAALTTRIKGLAMETAALSGISHASFEVNITSDFLGQGYGLPTEAGIEAIRLLARTEGIIADPVYSAKALGALIVLMRTGELADASNLIFLHTGGVGAVPAYRNILGADQR